MEGRRRVVQNLVNISCGDASRVEGTWVSPSFRGRRTWPQASQSADPGGHGGAWGRGGVRASRALPLKVLLKVLRGAGGWGVICFKRRPAGVLTFAAMYYVCDPPGLPRLARGTPRGRRGNQGASSRSSAPPRSGFSVLGGASRRPRKGFGRRNLASKDPRFQFAYILRRKKRLPESEARG